MNSALHAGSATGQRRRCRQGAALHSQYSQPWVGRGEGIPVGVLGSLSAWPSDWSLHHTHGQHVMSLMVTVLVLKLAGKVAGSPTASHAGVASLSVKVQ